MRTSCWIVGKTTQRFILRLPPYSRLHDDEGGATLSSSPSLVKVKCVHASLLLVNMPSEELCSFSQKNESTEAIAKKLFNEVKTS
ncbi:hypothetical protein NPIL_309411 [Nephila pilipes]|uniref:Uncharacterized protein n=1 Tax=Nephila pilipes TaxID=299642 RepID=A0A8X6U677_NEPPI|nr:hypothetical protein NPIL_309411 [Nephila pilipes]